MLYYTIYIKNLHNGTGYIDVALADDVLMKDYMQFLDINIRPLRSYPMIGSTNSDSSTGVFVVNLCDVTAISTTQPKQAAHAPDRIAPEPASRQVAH